MSGNESINVARKVSSFLSGQSCWWSRLHRGVVVDGQHLYRESQLRSDCMNRRSTGTIATNGAK